MKREINLPSKSLIPECWGYKGEVEHSRLIITLPDDIAACDYCQAEVAIKGKRYPTDRLEIADGKVSFELTAAMVKESGAISAQAIGYVVDEDGNIGEIGKTAIYRGTIKPSVSGEISETPEETEFWQRCWAGLQALLEKKHSHNNKKTLDGFYCESLETGFATDVSSEQLKWQGMPIEFQGFGAKIKRIAEVEKNGANFMRLWLDWGSMSFVDANTNFIDIPVAEVKNSIIEDDGGFILEGAELEFDTPESNGIKIVNELPADAKIGDVVCLSKTTERQAISAADIVPGETIITAIKLKFDVDYSNYPTLTENYDIYLQTPTDGRHVPWFQWHGNDEWTSLPGVPFFSYPYNHEYGYTYVCVPDVNFRGNPVKAGWYSCNMETYDLTPLTEKELLSIDSMNKTLDECSNVNAVFDNFVTFYTGEEHCEVDFYYYTGTEWVLMVDGIDDVKINGESIVTDGVANIPIAKYNKPGLVGYSSTYGVQLISGILAPVTSSSLANNRNNAFMTYSKLDYAVKLAMCDGKGAAWTDAEQAAARERMGVRSIGQARIIADITLEEAVSEIMISTDANGNPFSLKEMQVVISGSQSANENLYIGVDSGKNALLSQLLETIDSYGVIEFKKIGNDKCLVSGATRNRQGGYVYNTKTLDGVLKTGQISSFCIKTTKDTATFNVGIKIEIWGVDE